MKQFSVVEALYLPPDGETWHGSCHVGFISGATGYQANTRDEGLRPAIAAARERHTGALTRRESARGVLAFQGASGHSLPEERPRALRAARDTW